MSVKVPFKYFDPEMPSILFAAFEEMKKTGELCDVILKVGQHTFTAHRLVLVARVPYFRAMFNNQFAESYKEEVTMEEVDPAALGCLINFAYNGRLLITPENVETLLSSAIFLHISSAIEGCFQFLLKTIGFSTVSMIRTYAETMSNVDVIDSVDKYIRENFENFMTSEAFLSLPFGMLKELLERDDLFVVSEEVVFDAVMRWVKANESVRGTHLSDLLHCVRIHLLSSQYLATRIDSVKRILSSCECEDILDDIKNLFSTPEGQLSPHCCTARERCCIKKNHLKCTKLKGCGMYCIYRVYSPSPTPRDCAVLKYYDCIQGTWSTLCNDLHQLPNFVFGSYTLCTEESLCFLSNSYIVTLCLKTLECTLVEGEYNIPHGAEAILHNLNVYFFGGTVCDEDLLPLGYDFTKDVRCFSPKSVTAVMAGRMLEERKGHGVASLGDRIYITGGRRIRLLRRGPPLSVRRSAEVYYPESGKCFKISPMIQARYKHGCSALNGLIYAFGGNTREDEDLGPIESAEVYNPVTDQWCSIASMNRAIVSLSPVLYVGKLYAFERRMEEEEPPCIEVYDPDKKEWSTGGSISFPESFKDVIVLVTNTASKFVFV